MHEPPTSLKLKLSSALQICANGLSSCANMTNLGTDCLTDNCVCPQARCAPPFLGENLFSGIFALLTPLSQTSMNLLNESSPNLKMFSCWKFQKFMQELPNHSATPSRVIVSLFHFVDGIAWRCAEERTLHTHFQQKCKVHLSSDQ